MDITDAKQQLSFVFTYADAREAGLSKRTIYRLREDGLIRSIGRGLYRWADEEWEGSPENLDLVEAAHKLSTPTLCLETALVRHGLTDAIPTVVDIAIPKGSHRPQLDAPIRLHVFDHVTFPIGRQIIGPRDLGLYDAERTIVDMIRLRHLQGSDAAWDALRRWLRRPGASPNRLLRTARAFPPTVKPLTQALEVLM